MCLCRGVDLYVFMSVWVGVFVMGYVCAHNRAQVFAHAHIHVCMSGGVHMCAHSAGPRCRAWSIQLTHKDQQKMFILIH